MADKYMDPAEFVALGYLHEVNRRLLHPVGLALAVDVNARGKPIRLHGIWDGREDPEGIIFGTDLLDPAKTANFDAIWADREHERVKRLGFMVQPPDMEAKLIGALLDS